MAGAGYEACMVRIHIVGDRTVPTICCDRCAEKIEPHTEGLAIHSPSVLDSVVFHVHKGPCHQALRSALGGRMVASQELDDHLEELATSKLSP